MNVLSKLCTLHENDYEVNRKNRIAGLTIRVEGEIDQFIVPIMDIEVIELYIGARGTIKVSFSLIF